MNASLSRTAVGVLIGMVLPVSLATAARPAKVSGSIIGLVSDHAGIPQMGASVLLYNRFDRMLGRTLTSDRGTFSFNALSADVYTVRVSLASFLPALKRDIVVQPGMQSLLNVSLASVLSSIELVSVSPGQSSIMSDEWRWVLRSSSANRPVLRLFPDLDRPEKTTRTATTLFSDTRGIVKVSAGDQGAPTEPDLGTAFALATSFLGKNELQLSGNFGYSSLSGAPTTAIRTSFRREFGGGLTSPEVNVTMRQVALPRGVPIVFGSQDGSPMLRTLSATVLDSKQLADSIRLEYGTSIDSVTFLEHLNYVSPFGRLTYDGHAGTIQIGYASGTPPAEAFRTDNDLEFQQDLSALAAFPRVSLRQGAAQVQRTQTLEVGYKKKAGSRTYSAAAYADRISNGAVTLVAPSGMSGADLLPDLFSNSYTLNAGRYDSFGYVASVTQDLGSRLDVSVAYGSGNALVADRKIAQELADLEDLRSAIHSGRRHSLTARVSGTVPGAGTQMVASYQWTNVDALNPAHMYLTERVREGLGLNIRVRQPVPYFGGLPGHMEITAEMRNLLDQGYVPLGGGFRRAYLTQAPRSVRGGVSFNF